MFKNILVPIDPAEPAFADDALAKAKQLSKDYGAKLHLLAVCPEVQSFVSSQLPEGFQDREMKETETMLHALEERMELGSGATDVEVRSGTVDTEVIEAAKNRAIDLIIMTSHKPGLSTYFVGSHAAHIVRHAPCSVMVLRGD
ncbi:nucleotide-binding universal stress UspA family protein [Roseibium hamelinense]|uniref:Nucleotide-binding universal stress UspA family protein n=1 Tax=Roseibium hamelinense TaxID=150831 RepID=A0A562T9P6_9HYPH|nr:universal stress protein [Roseibium hamelinense]MTI45278.1 universal stress protein [Roseibium hamelinense]TWI90359.1 nucleotide-binding universal stress UspA family protein [Roseibium hamelinense]